MIELAVVPILSTILYSGLLIYFVYNIIYYQSLEKIVSSGTLFFALAYRALPLLQRLLQNMGSIQNNFNSLINLKKLNLLEKKKEINHKSIFFQNTINLKDISYQYLDGKNIFKNINICIKKNQKVGIIGTTGSGKSTLAKLILGILPTSSGSIKIDEQCLTEEYQKSWYSYIGYISQKIFIFRGSLVQNIAITNHKKEINKEKMAKILNYPWMRQMVELLDDKEDTIISEDGTNLSGGQIQRIAIARALYKDPDILILDEATNSLDNKIEKMIMETINSLNNKTIIIIAHRLSTLKNVDVIYHLKNNKIVTYSSYKEMLEKND